MGGAVVIEAASASDVVRTVITLATQSYGTEGASRLGADGSNRSILLFHGSEDRVLPSYCSSQVYERANGPKRLVIYEGAGHGLGEVADQVYAEALEWLKNSL
jgi:fermentation-respiration switch protein FrsA (DUF1100 family)